MFGAKSHGRIAAGLVSVNFSWGANNVGVKYLMIGWLAMLLIVTRLVLRQTDWQKMTGARRLSAQQADLILTTDEHR